MNDEPIAWVVWSEEHSKWWGPAEYGYTNSLRRAGRYTEAQAKAIAERANRDVISGDWHEIAMPDPWLWEQASPGENYTGKPL